MFSFNLIENEIIQNNSCMLIIVQKYFTGNGIGIPPGILHVNEVKKGI